MAASGQRITTLDGAGIALGVHMRTTVLLCLLAAAAPAQSFPRFNFTFSGGVGTCPGEVHRQEGHVRVPALQPVYGSHGNHRNRWILITGNRGVRFQTAPAVAACHRNPASGGAEAVVAEFAGPRLAHGRFSNSATPSEVPRAAPERVRPSRAVSGPLHQNEQNRTCGTQRAPPFLVHSCTAFWRACCWSAEVARPTKFPSRASAPHCLLKLSTTRQAFPRCARTFSACCSARALSFLADDHPAW